LPFCNLDLTVEIGDRQFEHVTQARVVGVLQLVQDALTSEAKAFDLPDSYCFLGGEFPASRFFPESGFSLLFFN
jgi:hypothetical protein